MVLSWEDVDNLADDLAALVGQAKCEPNLIIAVARGGFVPARLLASRLDVRRMASIGVTYTDPSRTEREIYSFPHPIGAQHRILLVEDAVESGLSMGDAEAALRGHRAAVWTAAFFCQSGATVRPGFCLGVRDHLPTFPWE